MKNYGFVGRFTPEAQDMAACKLLIECGAMPFIKAGKIQQAIAKAAPIWASLPGASYGQREHKLANLLEIYATERAQEEVAEPDLLAMYSACGGALA